ncbi:MAG: hypothetical protein O6913_12195 [Chloroflexi bacterium]|nr:hypothetical protein [Chloroflexota bacterium]
MSRLCWRRSRACNAAAIIARRGRPDYVVADRQLGRCSDLSVEFAAGLDIQGQIVEDGHFLVASEPA